MDDIDDWSLIDELTKASIDSVDSDINSCVTWYVMASYAYHVQKRPILSDSRFDRLEKIMIENWELIQNPQKDQITVDNYGRVSVEYPSKTENAVTRLREIYTNGK